MLGPRLTFALLGLLVAVSPVLAQERIRIVSEWGEMTAELEDNAAARAVLSSLPLTIAMTDHLRQEKTGTLPEPLPEVARERDFTAGMLGLWGPDHFVVYYRGGRVPSPGIVVLGHAHGNASMFDRPGSVLVRIDRLQ